MGEISFPFFPFLWRSGRRSQTERVASVVLGHDPRRRSLAFAAAGHLRQCAAHHIQSYDCLCERLWPLWGTQRGDRDSGTGTALLLECRGVAISVRRCDTRPGPGAVLGGPRGDGDLRRGGCFVCLAGFSFLFFLHCDVCRAVGFQPLSKWLI